LASWVVRVPDFRFGSCFRSAVAVHEIDLLQPAKALADVLRADLPDALDRFQFGSVAARISSSPRNSRTMFCTTSLGRRGMRPRIR
jgi:hypothetical protein